MFRKLFVLGFAYTMLLSFPVGVYASVSEPSIFNERNTKVIGYVPNQPKETGVLFSDEDDNILVAGVRRNPNATRVVTRAASVSNQNRKVVASKPSVPLKQSALTVSKSVSSVRLSEFNPSKMNVRPVGRISSPKTVAPAAALSKKTSVSVNQSPRTNSSFQKSVTNVKPVSLRSSFASQKNSVLNPAPDPLFSGVLENDPVVENSNIPATDFASEPERKPIRVAYEKAEKASRIESFDEKPALNSEFTAKSYKEHVKTVSSDNILVSDSPILSDFDTPRNSLIPSVREESDYQLLDYTNGITNKIYTKVGYATVLILPPGEKLNRITLGDRQRFNVSSVFDKGSGSWHIYLKPLQMDIETNIVISTNRHLFNATLATSSFFKPFAKWINVPGAVETIGVDDGALDLAVKDVNQLNFAYSRSGKSDYSWAPLNVFDDKSSHTFMNFDHSALAKTRPVVFTRGASGEMKMVPYSVYKDTYIIDNIYDNLEVRSGEKAVRYTRKR